MVKDFMRTRNISEIHAEPAGIIIDAEKQWLARLFTITLLSVAPLIFIVGIVMIPLLTGATYFWQGATFWPAASVLICSLISYLLIRLGKYYLAVIIYMYIFIFAPILAVALDSSALNLPIATLAIGGVLLAVIFLPTRLSIIMAGLSATVEPLTLPLFIPDMVFRDVVAIVAANATNSTIILIFSQFRDVMEYHRKTVRERLDYVIENSLNEIYIFTTDTLIFQYVNKSVQQNLKYTFSELKTMNPIDIKPEFNEQNFRELIAPLLNNEKMELVFETIHQRKDGSVYNVEVHLQFIEYAGEKTFVAFINDTTKRKQVEADLYKSHLELAKERDLRQYKERFLAMFSHEFRTPLAVIETSNYLLNKHYTQINGEDRAKHYARITDQVKQLDAMISNILLLGRKEKQSIEFNPQPVLLGEFCLQSINIVTNSMSTHKIMDTMDIEQDNVYLDSRLMQHVLVNLLGNAIKYSPDANEIHFLVTSTQDKLIFEVKDFGIGIPESEQAHIFDLFHRATNVEGISGTGLGLALAHEFVTLHGGTIQLESQSDVGTIFTVELPTHRDMSL